MGSTAAEKDSADITDFFRLGYRGARYALSHRAAPRHVGRRQARRPANAGAESRVLSQDFPLHRERSTGALVVHHPEATYFTA